MAICPQRVGSADFTFREKSVSDGGRVEKRFSDLLA
jgi:hypothetical protein